MKYAFLIAFVFSLSLCFGQRVPNSNGTLEIVNDDLVDNTLQGTKINDMGANLGDRLTYDGTDWNPEPDAADIFSNVFLFNEEFIGGKQYSWQGSTISTSSDQYDNHIGIGSYEASSGTGGVHLAWVSSTQTRIYPDMRFQCIIYAHTTFATAQDSVTVGFNGPGDSDACFFILKPDANIRFMTIKNGTQSSINTGVSFDINVVTGSDWTQLEFIVNGAGTSIDAYIQGVNVGTLSANIPNAAADVMQPQLWTWASVGNFELELDCWKWYVPNLTRYP